MGKNTILSSGTQIHKFDNESLTIPSKINRGKSMINFSDVRKDGELIVSAEE